MPLSVAVNASFKRGSVSEYGLVGTVDETMVSIRIRWMGRWHERRVYSCRNGVR
jgi:hypothetical protein